jgi:mRNA interferase MazF
LKRGEIWTSTADVAYGGKPRPVVIIQSDRFNTLDSATICGCTSDPHDIPLFRIPVEPSAINGLQLPSRIMVDKILTVPKNRLGYRVGRLDRRDLARLDQAIAIFLGFSDVEPT